MQAIGSHLLGLFGNNSDLAPNLEITVRIRTFSHPPTPSRPSHTSHAEGSSTAGWLLPPSLERSLARSVLGDDASRCSDRSDASGVQKASLMPARALTSPLSSMCSANKANEDHRMASCPASVASWDRRRTGERQAMVFRNSQSTVPNGGAGKGRRCPHHRLLHTTRLRAGAARDGPGEAGRPESGKVWGKGQETIMGPSLEQNALAWQGNKTNGKTVPSATFIDRASWWLLCCVPKCQRLPAFRVAVSRAPDQFSWICPTCLPTRRELSRPVSLSSDAAVFFASFLHFDCRHSPKINCHCSQPPVGHREFYLLRTVTAA